MRGTLLIIYAVLVYSRGAFSGHYSSSHVLYAPVQLKCGSSHGTVDCNWKYNGKTMNIERHYRYLFSSGQNTTDCSMVIDVFHEEDIGRWACWSLSTDQTDGELLDSHDLSQRPKQRLSDYLRDSLPNVTARVGGSAMLPCRFHIFLEECHWLRNGQPVSIEDRYEYRNNQGPLSDCTIRITSVRYIDDGSWQCTTSANDKHGYFASNQGWLDAVPGIIPSALPTAKLPPEFTNKIEEHPKNSTLLLGNTAKLNCKFKEPIRCVWLRQDQVISIGDRYSYDVKTEKGTKMADCSLTISNIQTVDRGNWRCVGAGDSYYPAIFSNTAIITLYRNEVASSIAHKLSHSVIIPFGKYTTLPCLFNSSVNCDWSREGKSVKIGNRYSYVAKETGKNATDCSIQIAFASDNDIGNWSCGRKLDYTNSYLEKAEISLSFRKAPSRPVVIYNNQREIKDGEVLFFQEEQDNLVCTCESGHRLPGLSWIADERPVPGIYGYQLVQKNLYRVTLRWVNANGRKRSGMKLQCVVHFQNVTDYSVTMVVNFANATQNVTRIISHPKNIVFHSENSTTATNYLTCIFNKPVNCSWTLNYKALNAEENYRFLNSKGINTTNCSIALNSTQAIVGQWSCSGGRKLYSTIATVARLTMPTRPVIKWDGVVVNEIELPGISLLHLKCISENGYPEPKLHWEMNGNYGANYSRTDFDVTNVLRTRIIDWLGYAASLENATSFKCVLEHPSLSKPQSAEVLFKKNKVPEDPIIWSDGKMIKSTIEIPIDTPTDISCVAYNGNPAANLSWELDGQRIAPLAQTSRIGHKLYTSRLKWLPHSWKPLNKSVELKCLAEHIEYEKPRFAQAVIKFVPEDYSIRLQTADRVLMQGYPFSFRCESRKAFNCTMKLNGDIVEDMPVTPSTPSHNSINNSRNEICIFSKNSFSEKYAGKWRCSSEADPSIESNEIALSVMRTPVGPKAILGFSSSISEIVLNYSSEIPRLKCVAYQGNPAATLKWVLDGKEFAGYEESLEVGENDYYTTLHWNSTLNLTQENHSAILKCVASHPSYGSNHLSTKDILVTLTKVPEEPVILFRQQRAFVQPLKVLAAELAEIKCVCANGNPVPKLEWHLDGRHIQGTYKKRVIRPGLYTAELQWSSRNNKLVGQGPIQLMCIASHQPGLQNRYAKVTVTVINPGRTTFLTSRPTSEPAHHSNLFYVGISIPALLLLSIWPMLKIYYRWIRPSSSGQSASTSLRRMFSFCLGKKRGENDEPSIHYSQIDKGRSKAAILCDENSE